MHARNKMLCNVSNLVCHFCTGNKKVLNSEMLNVWLLLGLCPKAVIWIVNWSVNECAEVCLTCAGLGYLSWHSSDVGGMRRKRALYPWDTWFLSTVYVLLQGLKGPILYKTVYPVILVRCSTEKVKWQNPLVTAGPSLLWKSLFQPAILECMEILLFTLPSHHLKHAPSVEQMHPLTEH